MIRLKVTIEAGRLDLDKRGLRATMRAAGREVAAAAKRLVNRVGGGGRLYYGPGGSAAKYRGGYVRGRYRASVAGQPPARITGTLARSFVVRPFRSGEGVVIRDTAFYSLFMETGARGGGRSGGGVNRRGRKGKTGTVRVMKPRQFLTVALQQRSASIGPRIARAVNDGVKFVREKA